jgi:hypothetical protein
MEKLIFDEDGPTPDFATPAACEDYLRKAGYSEGEIRVVKGVLFPDAPSDAINRILRRARK